MSCVRTVVANQRSSRAFTKRKEKQMTYVLAYFLIGLVVLGLYMYDLLEMLEDRQNTSVEIVAIISCMIVVVVFWPVFLGCYIRR